MDATATEALCRDCHGGFARAAAGSARCPACDSPRIVIHPELASLSVAHVDCDAFYAAVEKRDDPTLADRPVIVGGGRRGVVSTACYLARTYGVRSAMPMFKALKACPDAVVIRPNMRKYAAVARQVRELMLTLTPAVEPLSIDEAFLDLSGTERLHRAPAAFVLSRLQARIERDIGVTVSIGLSHNKFLAKIASDLDKPRGFALIGRAETRAFLAERPVSLIWGVGQVTQAKLASGGVRRIGDLQRLSESDLVARFGSIGLRLARLSHGEDDRAVRPERQAKTISCETTFETDLADLNFLLPVLRRLSDRVSTRLKAQDLAGRAVALKLKTADFRLRTRQTRLDAPSNLADRIFEAAKALLRREIDGAHFRLMGVGVSDLAPAERDQSADLMDPARERRAKAEFAMDDIRERFGPDGVALGLTFEARTPPHRKLR